MIRTAAMEDGRYLTALKHGRRTRVQHESLADAERESFRLAKRNPGSTVLILQIVGETIAERPANG